MNAALDRDIRQLLAFNTLQRLDRIEEAAVRFTFDAGNIYLSVFAEAMDHLDASPFREHDTELLRLAQVFEVFTQVSVPGVNVRSAALMTAALYWLSGYSANALVVSRVLRRAGTTLSSVEELMVRLFERRIDEELEGDAAVIYRPFRLYLLSGRDVLATRALVEASKLQEAYLRNGYVDGYVIASILVYVLRRLSTISFWESVHNNSTASNWNWRRYVLSQHRIGHILLDLWPSQRLAISKGLLDNTSSLVITTPTSSGKTKMTEFAFINDLQTDKNKRCLYLAPFRALVGEIEADLGRTFAQLGIPVASLYGGSETNELEVELSNRARVVIATPEKMAAVLKLSGSSLAEYGLIVLDEGHLLDSYQRGVPFELQISSLIPKLNDSNRIIMLSAVLPNADEIAQWIGGSVDKLATDSWQPTSTRIGEITRSSAGVLRLDYVLEAGEPLEEEFFVPRLISPETWSERNPQTHRLRQHTFPDEDNGSIAAALAFQFLRTGPVIVYAQQPRWATSVVNAMLERIDLQRPIDTHLVDDDNRTSVNELYAYVARRMGRDSIQAMAVQAGIGLHHGKVPQSIRVVIEEAFRRQALRLLVATNTIAQGVNFPARTVIMHSLPRADSSIRDFWNLVGRAGRATKETSGEVLVLRTGTLTKSGLRRFLDRRHIEPVNSPILQFVQSVLNNYPLVSDEAIGTLLANNAGEPILAPGIRAIDAHLLEVLTEDLPPDAVDPAINILVNDLLATRQATRLDAINGTEIAIGVRSLFESRRRNVLQRVPAAVNRRRYSRTALSVDSSLALDNLLPALRESLERSPAITAQAILDIATIACVCVELAGQNPIVVSNAGLAWIESGDYSTVQLAAGASIGALEDVVEYVEDVLVNRLPWVVNGMTRLFEEGLVQDENLPEWFQFLPQFLRYGVNTSELVWTMSLGIPDRRFAEFLIGEYRRDQGHTPRDFNAVPDWALNNRAALMKAIQVDWPVYFVQILDRSLDRYSLLRTP